MGCYNCGSSDGTDTKLCPRCAESRARRRNNPSAFIEQHHSYQVESKFPQYLIGSVMAVCITAFIGYNLYKDAQFNALPLHEKFYKKCLIYHEHLADRMIREQKESAKKLRNYISENGYEGVPNDALHWLNGVDSGSAPLREEIINNGKSYCLDTRNRCEINPTVCKCPYLRSQFGY